MRESVRYQLWIVAAASVICFTTLGGAALWDLDEALYAATAHEMFQDNNWIVPMFNGQMSAIKPPLMFWTMMAGFELFGVNEWGARFFSAVFGVATALAAFHFGRILCNLRVGLWTGLITATTIIFTVSARAATVDSALTLVTTLAFLLFVMARKDAPSTLKLRYAVPMYACIGAAVLAKGPVGMLLPLAAMGLYLLVADGWRNAFHSAWWMRPFTALIVVAAVAVPWHVAVGGVWLKEFYLEANLRPFQQPILGHGNIGSYSDRAMAVLVSISYGLYYIPAVLVGFFPWSVFLGPALVDTVRRIRGRGAWGDGCVLAACWFGTWFVFWSICKTKLPHYLLPAYPALAMLTACFIDRWLTEPASIGRWWLRNAWISMIVAGIGIMIAIPIVADIYLPGEGLLGMIGLIPILGGGWCWWQTAHDRRPQAVIALAVTAVIFLTAIFGFATLRVDRHQNAKPMIAAIRADWEKTREKSHLGPSEEFPPIATYDFFRESTVCYAGHPVTVCDDDEKVNRSARQELQEFLAKPRPSYVITTNEFEQEIGRNCPGQFQVLFRHRRFLAPGEMVVLRSGLSSPQ